MKSFSSLVVAEKISNNPNMANIPLDNSLPHCGTVVWDPETRPTTTTGIQAVTKVKALATKGTASSATPNIICDVDSTASCYVGT